MLKKSLVIPALGVILFSNALPAIAETSSVIPKEPSALKTFESTDVSSSQASTTQTTSDITASDSTIDNEKQELQKGQEDTQKDITTTAVKNQSTANNTSNEDISVSEDIASGTFGSSPWRIDIDGTLHIEAGDFGITEGNRWSPWYKYTDNIKQISFEGPVNANSDSTGLFSGLNQVTSINNIEELNTSKVTTMLAMFESLKSLKSLDLSHFDTSNVTNMRLMFWDLDSLENLDLSSFNTSKVTDMSDMFVRVGALKTLNLSSFNTENVTNMSAMFIDLTSLESLDLSSFNTSKVTNMSSMFLREVSLSSLNLSSFNTEKVVDMSQMFMDDKNLNDLDLSSFDTNAITTMKNMFDGTQLSTLSLGKNFHFETDAALADLKKESHYTGNWINVDKGTKTDPKGKNIWTSTQLMEEYDGSTDADTYVWQSKASDVTVKYLDADGNEIHKAQTISGNVGIGEAYDASTDAYKLEIDGYTLDTTKLPNNATGTLSNTAQTVTYVYTKNSVKAVDVTVKYLDADGNEIHKAQTISGNVGQAYDASTDTYKLDIDGYTLDTTKLPDNATGTLSDTAQTVTYVYTKNPVKAADVTVKYLDVDGNKILDDVVKSGNVGDAYSTDQKTIDDYTFKEVQGSATGTFTDQAQTVTYVYTKNNVTPSPKPDDHSDTPESGKSNGNKNDSTSENKNVLPQTGDNEGLSMIGMISGVFLILGITLMIIFKRKRQD